ncbi:DUF937 domain-containing protein [Deinococcus lacus]|uniref:DUF937 domain-containing protein n=1 Tax=Deinococcus lacus TaxID=392561 RepID=A0ABW1YA09_9DEIO
MDLFQLLGSLAGNPAVSQRLGAQPEQTGRALEAAVPLLLSALARNAGQGQAEAIAQAVGQHDPVGLERLAQGQLPDSGDGQRILGHIFGAQQGAAAKAVGQRAGLSPEQAMQLLALAAPWSWLTSTASARAAALPCPVLRPT